MRLHSFKVVGVGPIKQVSVEKLSDTVVLAGPNGVGKTNVVTAVMRRLQNAQPENDVWLIVEATNDGERIEWGKNTLDTSNAEDCERLRTILHRNQRRNKYKSSILNFDSDRSIRNIQAFSFSWDIGDPFGEDVNWDIGFNPMTSRYNDVRHSLFRLVEGQRRDIANRALEMQSSGIGNMVLDFPDILKPYKDAFWQLLAPKKLIEVDIKTQEIFYESNGQKLPLGSLSSGEREVVNIVFDFLLRAPSDCIIFFDEPELHLHPELSYKLLQTLSSVGERNQFIFCTHSPEIISASLENTVIFVTPPQIENVNQAVIVHREDETHHALQTLGQSIGVISLGKKLILVEGEESSLDKLAYGAILKNRFPEFVLVPVGGKGTLRSFDEIQHSILNKTIWGVEFFLLCDRDAVNAFGKKSVEAGLSTRIKMLRRYHLENYFLDSKTLAASFNGMEAQGSWLLDQNAIDEKIRDLALATIPYAVALNVSASIRESVGNISLMPKGIEAAQPVDDLVLKFVQKIALEKTRVEQSLDVLAIETLIRAEHTRLTDALEKNEESWKNDIPGRVIFNKFCGAANIEVGRLKQLYIKAGDFDQGPFQEIIDVFEAFKAG